MLAAERRDLLVERLRRDGKLIARDLAAELGVSEESLRRDLREMAAAGLCQRVYGGALPASVPPGTSHAVRSEIAPESKRHVGQRAASLITPGAIIILDGDTTGLGVVTALPPDLAATIITYIPALAAALADHPTVKVFMLGGWVHRVGGAATAEAANTITADLYLMAPGGIHETAGLTTEDPDEAALQRILISRAADTYALGTLDKIGTASPYVIAPVSELAGIVTDAPTYHPTVRQLRRQGINFIHAAQ